MRKRNMDNLKKRLGLKKSPVKDTDYVLTSVISCLGAIPTKMDWTSEQSPIRNQGAEGSCAGHAGTALKEWMEFIDYGLYLDLSERYLYEYAKKISGDTEGTSLKAISKVLIDNGICEEKYWKYVAGNPGIPSPEADVDAAKYKIQPVYTRIANTMVLKQMLTQSPIMTGVLVYKNWYRQSGGIIPDTTICERYIDGVLGGHAILFVGYDDTTKLFKFKNSWGEGWGDKGYGYLSYKEAEKDFMDAYYLVDISDENPWTEFKLCMTTVDKLTSQEQQQLKRGL